MVSATGSTISKEEAVHVEHPQEKQLHSSDPKDILRDLEDDSDAVEVHWRTWVVVYTAALQYTAYALILTSSGFWSGPAVAELGGASVQVWIGSVWLPISAILAGPYARIGDHVGRRWPWLIANALGVLGNVLIAAAPNIGTVILGVAFWGITFGGAGNTLAVPAEILPRRHRGTANQLLQIGGYIGSTVALLGGAGIIDRYPVKGWRYVFALTACVYALCFVLIFIFYRPPPPPNPTNAPYKERLLDFDKLGSLLYACGLLPLMLGLIWGGVTYPWNSAAVIACLVVGCVFLVIFALHQTYYTKEGLFHHKLFTGRNAALCLFCIFVEGFAYIVFNNYLGAEVSTLFAPDIYGLSLYFGAFLWGAAVFSAIYIPIAYKWRAINELLIWGFAVFLVGAIGFATVRPGSHKAVYGYAFICGVGTAAPISFLFAAAQLSIDPQYNGMLMGLMVSLRNAGGAIGPAVASAVYKGKAKSYLPTYIANAAIKAGLPAASLPTFVGGIAAGNATLAGTAQGATPAIIAAGHSAAIEAYAAALKYIWIVIIPFIVVSLICCICMQSVRKTMNRLVDRPLEDENWQGGHKAANREIHIG